MLSFGSGCDIIPESKLEYSADKRPYEEQLREECKGEVVADKLDEIAGSLMISDPAALNISASGITG